MNPDPTILEAALAAVRQGKGGITRLLTSDYFTFRYCGEEVLLTQDLRSQLEERLGGPLQEKVFRGLEGEVALVARRSGR